MLSNSIINDNFHLKYNPAISGTSFLWIELLSTLVAWVCFVMIPHNKKVSDEILVEKYQELQSVWKVAKTVGLCGQSVHERLSTMGLMKPVRKMTDSELLKIRTVYESGIKKGDGKLKQLSSEINRTVPFISRFARTMNLTTYSHQGTKEFSNSIGVNTKKWIEENGHPKGFLGKKHTEKSLAKISIKSIFIWANMSDATKLIRSVRSAQTRIENGTNINNNRIKASWQCGWREINEISYYFRSSWEYIYAQFLQALKESGTITDWLFESETFQFEKEGKSYTPDFKIILTSLKIEYHEVKGWMDARSKLKLKLFKKYNPTLTIKIIDARWFKKNNGEQKEFKKPVINNELTLF